MYHFRYVNEYQANQLIEEIERLLQCVYEDIGYDIPFTYEFIGSASRDMITYDPYQNSGYDADVNIIIKSKKYSPKEIRDKFRVSIDKATFRGYTSDFNSHCEDSTRVLTIKNKYAHRSSIKYSCDFAIIYYGKNGQEYIHYNKTHQRYYWNQQTKGFKDLDKRAEWLDKNGYWDEVLDVYLEKKNTNTIPDKHSRSLYAETINNLYHKYRR